MGLNVPATPLTSAPATSAPRATGLPLEPKPFGQFWVSPIETQVIGGEVLPLPSFVRPNWGVNGVPGVGSAPSSELSDAYQRSLGRVPVPLDFEVVAWGETVKGYVVALECLPDAHGKSRTRYQDVWTRYRVIGNQVLQEVDREGYADFCRRCKSLLPELLPVVESATLAREQARIDTMLSAGTPLGEREAARIEANLKKPAAKAGK